MLEANDLKVTKALEKGRIGWSELKVRVVKTGNYKDYFNELLASEMDEHEKLAESLIIYAYDAIESGRPSADLAIKILGLMRGK